MYISDKRNKALYSQQVLVNLSVTVFFALFGAVYEIFSHEVYSFYMIYAFAVPLVLGVLPFSILQARHQKKRIGRTDKRTDPRGCFFWNCGILTLATGCACKGALDIYGTTSRLLLVYPVAGLMLLAAGAILLPARRHPSEEDSGYCAPAADGIRPDYTRLDCVRPGYLRSDRVRPDYVRPNCVKPDYTGLDYVKPDYTGLDCVKPNCMKPDYTGLDYVRQNCMKPDLCGKSEFD